MALNRVEEKVWAIKLESVRGTAEASDSGATYIPVAPASEINPNNNLLPDEKVRGDAEARDPDLGPLDLEGTLEMEPSADKFGEVLTGLFGSPVTTEVANVVITLNTNDYIDFDEGAGEFSAQIAASTYALGTSSSQAGTLCKAIKDAMEAAGGAGTVTVSYSRTTKKFTIATTAATFNIRWNTGTNVAKTAATTLGYSTAANDTGGVSYTGDSEVESVYSHAFKPGTTVEHPLYTLFGDRSLEAKKYGGVGVGKVTMNFTANGRVAASVDVMAKSEAATSALTPDWGDDMQEFLFSDLTVEVAGSENTLVQQAQVVLDGGAVRKRVLTAGRGPADIVHGPFRSSGSFVLFFESATERDKFMAGTSSSLKVTATGAALGASAASLEIHLPRIFYTGAPIGENEKFLVLNCAFSASRDSGSGYSARATLVNRTPTYA